SVLFLITAKAVVAQGSLVQLDTAIFNMLQALRTEPADGLMVAMTELGGVRVLFLVSAAVAVWLILQRCWRTAAYWAATVGVAQGLVGLFALIASRARPIDLYSGVGHYAFPSGHATSSIIIYGFLAYLVAWRRSTLTRTLIPIIMAVGIALIGISRLYLGAHWLSDVLAGWCFGIAWLALAIIIHTRYGLHENTHPNALGVFAAVAILASGLWTFNYRSTVDLALYTARTPQHVVMLNQWTDNAWRQLPQRRVELGGDNEELFLLQWAESQDRLQRRLKSAGWSIPPVWSVKTALLWLSPNAAVSDLPVLPKYSRGKSSRLAFVMLDPAYPQQRIVLRLWRSDYLLQNSDPQTKTPIWYGAFYEESFKRPWHLFTLGIAKNLTDGSLFMRLLPADLDTVIPSAAPNASRVQTVLALPQAETTSDH
ncbi:MAG: phosphatase PAP2 family protein, partial [Burkholderiaceae bacterium]